MEWCGLAFSCSGQWFVAALVSVMWSGVEWRRGAFFQWSGVVRRGVVVRHSSVFQPAFSDLTFTCWYDCQVLELFLKICACATAMQTG